MKPFNVELAKQGHPIVTRDGRKAEFVAHRPDFESPFNVCVIISEQFYSKREDGTAGCHGMGDLDLFMAPTKKTYWFGSWQYNAVESCRIKRFSTHIYDSKEAIRRDWPDKPDMTISSIEIEE